MTGIAYQRLINFNLHLAGSLNDDSVGRRVIHYSKPVRSTTSSDKRYMLKGILKIRKFGSEQLIGDTFPSYCNIGELRYRELRYLFYDITLINCPLVNLNSLCLPIHWKLLLMCTCTKLSFIQSSFWGYFQRINPLETSDFLWMNSLKIINVWNVLHECMLNSVFWMFHI